MQKETDISQNILFVDFHLGRKLFKIPIFIEMSLGKHLATHIL